jgi:N-acyl-L-homoserine lactone synthetase
MASEELIRFHAIIGTEQQNADVVDALLKFRKTLFADTLGWILDVHNGRERDQFDTAAAVHCALFEGTRLIGGFRAIRTDGDYLARSVFPHLAALRDFPRRPDVWEISRFGVLPGEERRIAAKLNYSLMFHFARWRGATSLVAVVDLTYERFLKALGIRTRRYGPPQVIGRNARGAPMWAVAGEIPLAEQTDPRFHALLGLAKQVEIEHDTMVLRRRRVSA